MVVFTAFMYFAKRYNIQYNIPNIVTTARLIINIFILILLTSRYMTSNIITNSNKSCFGWHRWFYFKILEADD